MKGIYTFIEKSTYNMLEEMLNNPITDYSLDEFEYAFGDYIDNVRHGDAVIYIEQINKDGVYQTFLKYYDRNAYDKEAYIGSPEYYSIRVTPNQFLEALRELRYKI